MADFFFFTEPTKLNDQTAGQAFGAIDENQFRVDNMFTATSDAKTFAITDGLVLVQTTSNSSTVNLILKPTAQPDLSLPKINYVVYTGIKADSLITGNLVADASKNDLTSLIHNNAVQWYAAEGTAVPATEPAAGSSLGIDYSSDNPDANFTTLDTDLIDDVFFSSDDVTLPLVVGGNHIGDFDSSVDFGVTIVFEKIGFNPTFELARSLTPTLLFDPLGGTPANADIFRRKHEKEDVHNFMDSAAFFGAFINSGLKVFDGSTFVNKSADDLYNEVISKHFNKNKIYLDIRNEFEDSYNYYENYSNTIQWNLDNTDILTDVDYYRNDGWPLLIIDDSDTNSEFDTGNLNRLIKLSFTRGDNESPLVYYRRAYKEELGFDLPTGLEQFYSPAVINDAFISEDLIPYVINNRASADYFQIKIIKRVILENDEVNDFPRQGHSLFKRSYLDNLFPIFDLNIPFTNANYTNLKIYYDSSYIDKVLVDRGTLNDGLSEYALRDFVSSTGIASDVNNITFMAFPFKYHTNQDDNDDFIPLSGLETTSANPFLIELDNLISQVDLIRSSFLIGGTQNDFLEFTNNELVNGETNVNQYSFDDVILLSITRTEFQNLQQLKDQNFTGPYKVYLGVKNISVLTDDNGNNYSSFTYVLRGLTEVNDTIEPLEVNSVINSITSDAILGINSEHIFPIPTPFISSDFGWRVLNGANVLHNGIDLVSPVAANTLGTPIFAVKGGEVTRLVTTEDGNGGGVRVRIRSAENNQIEYNYFHMITNSNDHLTLGQVVQQGDQIGEVGTTGSSTAPHLHFEIWNGTLNRIDPYSIFPELALLPYRRHRDEN